MVQASSFISAVATELMELVQISQNPDNADDADATCAPAAVYENHGESFVETLEDLQEKSESQLAEARQTEATASHNFQLLQQSWEDELKFNAPDLEAAKHSLGESPHVAGVEYERSLTGFVRDQFLINSSTYFVVSTRKWTGSKGPISWALLTFSCYAFPRPRSHATGRSPHSADHFGQNGWFTVSSFLVTKLEQHWSVCSSPILMSQQLLRRLVSCDYCCNNTDPPPWSHIELHLLRPNFLRFCSGSISLDSSSGTVLWAYINTQGHSTVWLRARDGVEFSLPALMPTSGRSTSGLVSLCRDSGKRVLRGVRAQRLDHWLCVNAGQFRVCA